jgi:hypothetical protein
MRFSHARGRQTGQTRHCDRSHLSSSDKIYYFFENAALAMNVDSVKNSAENHLHVNRRGLDHQHICVERWGHIPDRISRAFQERLLSRRLRHPLPLQQGLSGEILISARSMPEQLRQRLKVAVLRNETAFEIPLKHHAQIEG